MNWLIIVRTTHTYSDDDMGYEITSIRCASQKAAEQIVAWLSEKTKPTTHHGSYSQCLIVKDVAT